MSSNHSNTSSKPRIVILISGNGSNLQAFIDAVEDQQLDAEIVAVISNRPQAYGLERAKLADITTKVIDHTLYSSREAFDEQLQSCIDEFAPNIIVLAGFMRILTAQFTEHYLGRMVNIHPSLLPKYPGLNTHQKALEANDAEHGVTVHFVTPTLDDGPNILQARVAIDACDNVESLAKKVQSLEHIIYPKAVQWLSQGRLKMIDNRAYLDDQMMPNSGFMLEQLSSSS